MVFEYVGMLAVPVLLVALTLTTFVPVGGTVRMVLLLLLAGACVAYGGVAVRAIYIHGGTKRETTAR